LKGIRELEGDNCTKTVLEIGGSMITINYKLQVKHFSTFLGEFNPTVGADVKAVKLSKHARQLPRQWRRHVLNCSHALSSVNDGAAHSPVHAQ
jgi:hypothetical protein